MSIENKCANLTLRQWANLSQQYPVVINLFELPRQLIDEYD